MGRAFPMFISVHPVETMLRGDLGYNPRGLFVRASCGSRELITGVFRDDGSGSQRRPDRPFRIVLPVGFEAWQWLNTLIYRALQSQAADIIIDL
jgi:hypothetical protein